MLPGLRVVRGPSWAYGEEDGGEGNIGTVIQVKGAADGQNTVYVVWDHGPRCLYRTGQENAYDLRVFDNAATGVEHSGTVCGACHQRDIQGICWKCVVCDHFSLCTKCYMADHHDARHDFIRFNTPSSAGVDLSKREGSPKVASKGIFPGAVVIRGLHWEYGDQDGKPDNFGSVAAINQPHRGTVRVHWREGEAYDYRLGKDGKVDLRCIRPALGGTYYKDHLPVVSPDDTDPKTLRAGTTDLRVGDIVKVSNDFESLKQTAAARGVEWKDEMTFCLGKTGRVIGLPGNGIILIKLPKSANNWLIPETALVKVNQFSVHDLVQILSDLELVKRQQHEHGEWYNFMKDALGKTGRVLAVDYDGDIDVQVEGMTSMHLNPNSCILVQRENPRGISSGTEDSLGLGTVLMEQLKALEAMFQTDLSSGLSSFEQGNLFIEAERGNLENVSKILRQHKDQVDKLHMGHTPLQVASLNGHQAVVKKLLDTGASIDIQTTNGDTALIYAILGSKPVIVRLLLSEGANVDTVNNIGETPLTLATKRQQPECVRIILDGKADANIQDQSGNTPLHIALAIDNSQIVEQLLNTPKFDFSLRNTQGLTVLHHAAIKNNVFAVKMILQKAPEHILDEKAINGFSALHFAAYHGHSDIAEALITVSKTSLNSSTNQKLSPLHLAAQRCNIAVVSLLLQKGASVDQVDWRGDTPLHHVCQAMKDSGSNTKGHWVELACILAQHGADPGKQNDKGETPLDIVKETDIVRRVRKAAEIGCELTKRTTHSTSSPEVTSGHSSKYTSLTGQVIRHQSSEVTADGASAGGQGQDENGQSACNTALLPDQDTGEGSSTPAIPHEKYSAGAAPFFADNDRREVQPTANRSRGQQRSDPERRTAADPSSVTRDSDAAMKELLRDRHIKKYRVKKHGGIIDLQDGVRIVVPAYAFSEGEYRDLLVGITQNELDMPSLANSQRVSPVVIVSPHGMIFEKPIAMLIPYGRKYKSALEASADIRILHSQTEIGMPTRWCRWDNSNTGDPEMTAFIMESHCIFLLTHLCLFAITTRSNESVDARSMEVMVFLDTIQDVPPYQARLTVIIADDADTEAYRNRLRGMHYGTLVSKQPLIIYDTGEDVHFRLKALRSPWKLQDDDDDEETEFEFQLLWQNLCPCHHINVESNQANPGPIRCRFEVKQEKDSRGLGGKSVVETCTSFQTSARIGNSPWSIIGQGTARNSFVSQTAHTEKKEPYRDDQSAFHRDTSCAGVDTAVLTVASSDDPIPYENMPASGINNATTNQQEWCLPPPLQDDLERLPNGLRGHARNRPLIIEMVETAGTMEGENGHPPVSLPSRNHGPIEFGSQDENNSQLCSGGTVAVRNGLRELQTYRGKQVLLVEFSYYRQLYDLYSMVKNSTLKSCGIPFGLATTLGHLLDPEDPLNRDWRLLAEKMGFSGKIQYINSLKGQRSPTEFLLILLMTLSDEPLKRLKEMLKCMERADAVKEVEKCEQEQAEQTLPRLSLPREDEISDCSICSENVADVKFEPCGHTRVCRNCLISTSRMKKCPSCKTPIENLPDVKQTNQALTQETLPRDEETIAEWKCSICTEQKTNRAFIPCGHRACAECAEQIHKCHVCRKEITQKLGLY